MAGRGPRILGGRCKGRVLGVAGSARPTEGKVRKSLFDIWSHRLAGRRVLDLFAGSGAVGLEAASRGAKLVVLVERDPRSLGMIRRNAEALGLVGEQGGLVGEGLGDGPQEVRTLRLDLPTSTARWLRHGGPERVDLIFADPPYAFGDYSGLLRFAAGLLDEGGEIAVEHAARVDSERWLDDAEGAAAQATGALGRSDLRSYGDSALSFFRRVGS